MVRPQPTAADLSATLRALRLEQRLTVDDVAGRAGMHSTYLSRIERGRCNPTWPKLCDLGTALGVGVSGLAALAEDRAAARAATTP